MKNLFQTILVLALVFSVSVVAEVKKGNESKSNKEKTEKMFGNCDIAPSVEFSDLNKNLIYPENARTAGIEGRVEIKAFISKNGKVTKATVNKTDNKILNQAAIDAVKKTKFTPGTIKNKAVDAWVILPIKFRLK
jgi:TonB family protein